MQCRELDRQGIGRQWGTREREGEGGHSEGGWLHRCCIFHDALARAIFPFVSRIVT